MRLQKTVNSPTQLRPSRRKQGRDGANNKAGAPDLHRASNGGCRRRRHLSSPVYFFPSQTPSPLYPCLALPPHHPPTPLFLRPGPPLSPCQSTACCLGNNTKRFFSTAPSPRQHLVFLQAIVRSARPATSHSGPDARRIGRNLLCRCRQVWTDADPERWDRLDRRGFAGYGGATSHPLRNKQTHSASPRLIGIFKCVEIRWSCCESSIIRSSVCVFAPLSGQWTHQTREKVPSSGSSTPRRSEAIPSKRVAATD